jgi:hypothetical protein
VSAHQPINPSLGRADGQQEARRLGMWVNTDPVIGQHT